MKKTSVDMGCYYNSANQNTLVRTICKAKDVHSNENLIVYAQVGEGGYASEPFAMREADFIEIFVD